MKANPNLAAELTIKQVKLVAITKSLLVRDILQVVPHSIFAEIDKKGRQKLNMQATLSIIKNKPHIWKDDNYFFVANMWSKGYYHWMTEVAIKFALFEEELKDGIVIIPQDPPKFIMDFIDICGIKNYRVMKGSCFLKKLNVVSNPISGNPNPQHIQQLRDFILDKIPDTVAGPEKIYISRRLARNRKVVNEQEVMDALKAKGFHCVELENYPWREQVNLFRNCKQLVSIHGAGLTNVVFMASGARMLEIYPQNPEGDTNPNPCYAKLSATANVKHQYLLSQRQSSDSNPDFHQDDLVVDLDKLNALI